MNRNAAPNLLLWCNGPLERVIPVVPFMLELRAALPHCRIAVAIETRGAELLANYPEISQLVIDNRRSEHRGIFGNLSFLNFLRAEKFTHAFLLEQTFRNRLLSFLAGIPNRYGFHGASGNRLLTRTLPEPVSCDAVKNHLSLLSFFNITVPETAANRFYTSGPDQVDANRFLNEHHLPAGGFAALHISDNRQANRRPRAELFNRVLKTMAAVPSFPAVRIEEPDTGPVAQKPDFSSGPIPVLCEDRIRVTAEVLRRARLFIGNDSVFSRLAVLVGTPVFILTGEYDEGALRAFIENEKGRKP